MLEIFFTRDSWKYTWDFFVFLQSLLSLMSPFLSSSLLGKPPPQCSRAVFKNQPTVCLLFLLQPFTPHEIFLGNTRERRNTNRGSVGNSRAERIHVLLSVRRYSTSFNHIFCFKSVTFFFWVQICSFGNKQESNVHRLNTSGNSFICSHRFDKRARRSSTRHIRRVELSAVLAH